MRIRAKKKERKKPGPAKTNDGASYLLKLPAELDGLVRAAAKEDGVPLAEWWRAAGVAALMLRARERNAAEE